MHSAYGNNGAYRRHVAGPGMSAPTGGMSTPPPPSRGAGGSQGSLGQPGPAPAASNGRAQAAPSNMWQWRSKIGAPDLGAKLKKPARLVGAGLRVFSMVVLAAAALLAWRHGVLDWTMVTWLMQQTSPELLLACSGGALCTYTAVLLQAIGEMITVQNQRKASSKWGGSLDEKQRRLLGLAPTPAPQQQAARKPEKGSAPAAPRATPPLGPPQRPQSFPRQMDSLQYGSMARSGSSPYTPLNGGSGVRPGPSRTPVSPFSHPSPTGTPEPKLEDYLRHLDSEMTAMSTPPGADAYDPGSDFFRGYSRGSPSPLSSSNLFSSAYRRVMGAGAAGSSPATLPHGPDAPKYRPSPQPRSTAGVPREDGRLTASHQDAIDAVLQRLDVTPGALEIWTEKLRQWMASSLLQPLVEAMDRAAADVAAATQAVGLEGIRFSELGTPTDAEQRGPRQGLGGGQVEADEQLMMTQLLEWIENKGRTQQLTQPEVACYEAVKKYKHLSKLLSGQQPPQMLQAAPRGYIAARVRQLADSSCMMGFDWKKGADYGGKPWSTELPTDSSLVFYLFSAYLEAPSWEWPLQPPGAAAKGARAGPLYVSSLPSRPAEQYTAILPFRPVNVPKGAAAVLGLALASANPHFSLLLDGEVVVTLAGANAVLHVLLLLVQYVKLHRLSLLGEHHLDQRKLNLLWVIEDEGSSMSFVPRHWFGLW